MSRRLVDTPRAASLSTLVVAMAAAIPAAGSIPDPGAVAGTGPGTVGRVAARAARPERPRTPTGPEAPRELPTEIGAPSPVVARYEGEPAPGRSVTLRAAGLTTESARLRWRQIRGEPVQLDRSDAVRATFTMPETDEPLGFLLVVADAGGIDSAEVLIPARSTRRPATPRGPRADAGDDQFGLIGRQVTLNGMRSGPAGRIAYRWVQTGGPVVRLKIEEGFVYSFVPTVPGLYRFALVVAADSTISEPDEVCVTVGSGARSAGMAPASDPLPTQEIARAGLKALRLGAEAAEQLARAFEDTADRMDLYENYAETFAEMSRRLQPILPENLAERRRWDRQLFEPLTARVVEVLGAEGLDFRRPESRTVPLAAGHRAALADQFRLIADGLRAARPVR